MITFVHALWGDEYISTWPKILRDIQWGWSWRNIPDGYQHLVFGYGNQNCRYLRQWQLPAKRLSIHPVVDFFNVGNREYEGRGSRGTFNYGISMWEHKRHAIANAFEHGCDEVLWLDWDTRVPEKNQDVVVSTIESLRNGPEFQGRLRSYKNRTSGGGLKRIYHGGCYYVRSPAVIEELARIRPLAPYVTDEVLITWAINNLYFDGRDASPEEHRAAGFDNPRLYGTRMNAVPSDKQPAYFEGNMDKSQAFLKEQKKPANEYQFYRPEDDTGRVAHEVV